MSTYHLYSKYTQFRSSFEWNTIDGGPNQNEIHQERIVEIPY